MGFVHAEHTLSDAASHADAQSFAGRDHRGKGVGVLGAGEGTGLEALQSVLNDGQQVVIEDASLRSGHSAGTMLELDAAHVFRAAVLNAIGVTGVASVGVASIEGGDVGGGVVRDGLHSLSKAR